MLMHVSKLSRYTHIVISDVSYITLFILWQSCIWWT